MEGITVAGDTLEAEVAICSGHGCHHAKAPYATNYIDQMRSLVERSLECYQQVQIHCLGAPLKVSFCKKTEFF